MAIDWLHILKSPLAAGWEVTTANKVSPGRTKIASDLPWIYSNVEFDCTVWNRIFHNVVAEQKLVHSHCHNCFKIVAKPKTLRELVTIEQIQQSMLYPCKCGIDMRDNTQDIYGAFWYNRGLEEARHRYPILRKRLDEEGLSHVPLIIKRACTEFENEMGPSDQWEPPSKEQLEMEAELDEVLDYTPQPPNPIPKLIKTHTHHEWVQWAFKHGDNTYLEFTEGVPIHKPLVTYDPESNEEKLKKELAKVKAELKKVKKEVKSGKDSGRPQKSRSRKS